MRHYDGLSISVLQKAREPGGFSIYIIKSNTKFNKELNTTMLTHSQEGLKLCPRHMQTLWSVGSKRRAFKRSWRRSWSSCVLCYVRWCKFREMELAGVEGGLGAGQRCAADSTLEGEKWHPRPSWEIVAPFVKLSSPTGHSRTSSACTKEFFIACGRTRQATTSQSS